MRNNCLASRCIVAAVLFLTAAATAHSETLVVRNTNNNFVGSLRQAIQDAAPGDTIVFQIPTTDRGFDSNTGIYEVGLFDGELVINKDLTIDGAGAKIVVRKISTGTFRIFNVVGGNVTIANLTISGGDSHLSTPAGGSGLYNTGNLVLRNCTFENNGVGSELGGGIRNLGTLEVTNCTFADNIADGGSGIYNEGNIFVRNSSIARNRRSAGFHQKEGSARVRSTIIAENAVAGLSRPPDVVGAFTSEGYNLVGNGAGSTGFGTSGSRDQVGTTSAPAFPGLTSLAYHGGWTPTFGLFPGSPAIDQGSSGGINFDQRGVARPFDNPGVVNAGGGDGTDIGSYELGTVQAGPSYTVTTVSDHNDGCTTDDCTLREAIAAANESADANTINFSPAVTGVIIAEFFAYQIAQPLTIDGPGARRLAVSGRDLRQVFNVRPSARLIISGLTIEEGRHPGSGGGIENYGDVTLNDCTVASNVANEVGGGVYNHSGAQFVATGCTFRGNNANNSAGRGGGAVFNLGFFTAVNCTFSSNGSSSVAGAIRQEGSSPLTLINCTITNNFSSFGTGAVHVVGTPITLTNTIIAGNSGFESDVLGRFTSDGHNFIGKADGSTGFTHGANGDQVGTRASPRDPRLGPLENNGGQTDTHALLSGSTAINAGDDRRARTYDQRNFSRVGVSDIGAFELGGLPTGLANISTRVRVGSGDNVLIGGFIVTGTQPKRLMARAIGPSTGISGALADPELEIFNAAGERVGFNNNWREAPNRDEMIATTIAPANDLESAVLGSVIPGAYTAVVRGVGGGTGVGLVEVFDLNRAADSKLANISTRGVVRTGDDVMIGGFIIVGARQQRTLIRALGPSLPLAGTLSDPVLEIYSRDGTLLVSNDNWRSDQEAEIAATGIPPASNLEAAIIGDVSPSAYTAIVRGVGGGTGVALVEVYALD